MFVYPLAIIAAAVASSLRTRDDETAPLANRLFGDDPDVLWRAGPSPLWTGPGSFWAEDRHVAERMGVSTEAVERTVVFPGARVLHLPHQDKLADELERLGFDPASIDCEDMDQVREWGNELYSYPEVRDLLQEHWDWVRQPIDETHDQEWVRIFDSPRAVLEAVVPDPPDRPTGHESSLGRLLVVVDVQPTYAGGIHFEVRELVQRAVRYDSVLWLYNGEVNGLSEEELMEWLQDRINDEELYDELTCRAEFYDKGYAFLRDWMDYGVSREDIVMTLVAMRAVGVDDARELPEDIKADLPLDPESWTLYIPELSDELTGWDGSVVCGGGEEECLEEVLLLADALGVQLHPLHEFVYA